MGRVLLCLLAASCLFGQFSELAVTDDGRLLFTTALHTGTEGSRPKVYRVTSDGLSLFANVEPSDDPVGAATVSPLTSGDGSITGYAVYYPCRTGSCGLFALPRTFFTVEAAGLDRFSADTMQVSRNGRYLLTSAFSAASMRFNVATRMEIATGERREFPDAGFPASTRQAIANDGSFLVLNTSAPEVRLSRVLVTGEERVIVRGEGIGRGLISPDAGRVVYERAVGTGYELYLTDGQGSTHTLLGRAGANDAFQPSFSNHGTLLYLVGGEDGLRQPVLAEPGAGPRTLATIPSGVTQAILSGNGELAWLATGKGQLLRVRTADGVADEIIAETPILRSGSFFAYPGSVIRLNGTGLDESTRVDLEGLALPFSERTNDGLAVQIPWEYAAPPNTPRRLTIAGPRSAFRYTTQFRLLEVPSITFERDAGGQQLQAAHQDFRGVVTAEDPARRGETIHVYVRNMGPVDRAVATGERSPVDPPARVTLPVACYLYESDDANQAGRITGLEVPFAGLAGGAIGIYQIDVTIPVDWTARAATLQCRTEYRGDVGRVWIGAATSP
ncbi:MAG: hypothetical protein J0L64_19055 [Acidobacteria bacterium]|nr:hypothetical protein [Acidobacteriota bacterium]